MLEMTSQITHEDTNLICTRPLTVSYKQYLTFESWRTECDGQPNQTTRFLLSLFVDSIITCNLRAKNLSLTNPAGNMSTDL